MTTLNSFKSLCLLILVLLPLSVSAKDIRVIGRKTVTVTTPEIKLSDLAEITNEQADDEDAVIGLKKLVIGVAPKPGSELTLAAHQVIEKLRDAGVNFDSVGYAFPKVVTVRRAGRRLERSELQAVMERVLDEQSRDLAIKGFTYGNNIMVPTGELKLTARMFSGKQDGQVGFAFEAQSKDEAPQRFELIALVDEWQDVPVAARPLARGAMIRAEDITLERHNITELPRDAALSSDSLTGYSISQDIALGDVFRRSRLSIPPVITSGSNVTLVYRQGALEAKATGVALESGAAGDEIKVRNDGSKRIVLGRVIEPGIVGVGP